MCSRRCSFDSAAAIETDYSNRRLLGIQGPSYHRCSLMISKTFMKNQAYIQNGEVYFEIDIKGLLSIRTHLEVPIDQLATIDSKGLFQKEACLVPMCGRSCRPCL